MYLKSSRGVYNSQLKSGQRGSALTEAAIVFPLLSLVLFGIIQYGMILGASLSLRNASVVAARVGSLGSAPDCTTRMNNMTAAAQNAVTPMLDPNLLSSIVPTCDDIAFDPPRVSIALTYDLPVLIPYVVPGSQGGIFQLNASAVMR